MRDELYHYGRKGMKWGQHIFGDSTSRRMRKLNKLSRRSDEQRARAGLSETVAKYGTNDKRLKKQLIKNAAYLNRTAEKNRHKADKLIRQLSDSGVEVRELKSYSTTGLGERYLDVHPSIRTWTTEYDARVYARKKE